jgi:hypothetical protein
MTADPARRAKRLAAQAKLIRPFFDILPQPIGEPADDLAPEPEKSLLTLFLDSLASWGKRIQRGAAELTTLGGTTLQASTPFARTEETVLTSVIHLDSQDSSEPVIFLTDRVSSAHRYGACLLVDDGSDGAARLAFPHIVRNVSAARFDLGPYIANGRVTLRLQLEPVPTGPYSLVLVTADDPDFAADLAARWNHAEEADLLNHVWLALQATLQRGRDALIYSTPVSVVAL